VNATFLDTVGLLALLELSDQWNQVATRALASPSLVNRPLVTTTLVFLESGNAVARKPYRRQVAEMLREFRDGGTLITPTEADLDAAWFAYERGEAGQAGIIDHVSFVVMRRLGLTQAFTNDGHFRAAGFETLF